MGRWIKCIYVSVHMCMRVCKCRCVRVHMCIRVCKSKGVLKCVKVYKWAHKCVRVHMFIARFKRKRLFLSHFSLTPSFAYLLPRYFAIAHTFPPLPILCVYEYILFDSHESVPLKHKKTKTDILHLFILNQIYSEYVNDNPWYNIKYKLILTTNLSYNYSYCCC